MLPEGWTFNHVNTLKNAGGTPVRCFDHNMEEIFIVVAVAPGLPAPGTPDDELRVAGVAYVSEGPRASKKAASRLNKAIRQFEKEHVT